MSVLRKVAIVTGVGAGIGKCTVLALLREGYAVVLAGRRVEPLERTVKEAGPFGLQALVVPTDVSEPASVRALFTKTKEILGRLDQNNWGQVPILQDHLETRSEGGLKKDTNGREEESRCTFKWWTRFDYSNGNR